MTEILHQTKRFSCIAERGSMGQFGQDKYVQVHALQTKLADKNFAGMTMNTKLSKLPVEERIKLVEELWDSIASDQMALPLTNEQKVEFDRRLDAYEADGNRGRLATKSITEIRRNL